MNISGKLPLWVVLVFMACISLALIILPEVRGWTWDHGVIRDIGIALLSAAVLGFTIDRWLKDDIAKDVFKAALGYVLPEELRDEIRWITGFPSIARKYICHVNIQEIGDGVVKVIIAQEKEIENLTSCSEKIRAAIAIDEWGYVDYPSEILVCEIQGGDEASIKFNNQKIDRKVNTITAQTEEISVEPREKVKLFYKTIEYKRINDDTYLMLQTPTKDPALEVTVSGGLEYSAGFGHRGEVIKERYSSRCTLNGTFLPTQHLRVRWWPKAKGKQ